MSGMGFEISVDDVANVLRSCKIVAGQQNGKSLDDFAAELFENLDESLIEDAALAADITEDLDDDEILSIQTDCALDEIARQLREQGVLEPEPDMETDKFSNSSGA